MVIPSINKCFIRDFYRAIIKNNFKFSKLNLAVSTPYISVIIPVYNRTLYVGEAINSVLNQTLDKDKYEIIVVTNVDLPEREGVKIIKSNERWLGPKIAEGIEEAKGEVISLLEDDDLFLPNKLEIIYKIFRDNNKIGLVKNPIKWMNELGKEWLDPLPKEPKIVSHENLKLSMLSEIVGKYKVGFNNSSMSFRKRDIKEYLTYLSEIKLIADKFIGLLFLFTSQIVIWNQPLSIYRVSLNSATYKMANLDQYIQHTSYFKRLIYEDYSTLHKALKNSSFSELLEKSIKYEKVALRLWSNNTNEVRVTLKDVLDAVPIYDPKFPKLMILLAYWASFMPYSLKKKLIFERFYKKELRNLKFM